MAQNTFVDGDVLTASDINTYLAGEGGAWTSWTPVVTQGTTVTVTNTRSMYARYGRLIVANFNLAPTSGATAANAITLSLPVTAAASGIYVGTGQIFDTSSGDVFAAALRLASTTQLRFRSTSVSSGSADLGSSGFSAALASGDQLTGTFMYEAAS